MFCTLLLLSLPCHRILLNIGPLRAFRASSPNYDELFNLTAKMLLECWNGALDSKGAEI